MTSPPASGHPAAYLGEAAVGSGQHGRDPLALGVQRRAPGVRGEVLGQRLAEAGGDLVAGLGAPAHRAAVGQEEHRPHDAVAQRLGVAVGVVGGGPADAVAALGVGDERDGAGVRPERRAGEADPAGGGLERLADRVAPGQVVAAVVDLVEDDQRGRGLGAGPVQQRLAGHLGVGERHAVELGAVPALGVGEVRVDADAHPAGGVGPLGLEVLGGGDDGDPPDDPPGQQLGGEAQRVGRLAGAGRGDGEEVAGVLRAGTGPGPRPARHGAWRRYPRPPAPGTLGTGGMRLWCS